MSLSFTKQFTLRSNREKTAQHTNTDFLTSASTDQVATTNKDKEKQGGDTQSDVAVIAGLFSSFVLTYLAFWF